MVKFTAFRYLMLLALALPVSAKAGDVLDEVNLFMGTAADYGQMSPGATVPFGMVQVAPDCRPRQHPGYDYEQTAISGFSVNRLSGVGGSGCGGNLSLLPEVEGGEVHLLKETEEARPGYYHVQVTGGVDFGATATQRMAVEHFTFPDPSKAVLLLSPASAFDWVYDTRWRIVNDRVLEGSIVGANTCGRGRYHLHYRIYTSAPVRVRPNDDGRLRLVFQRLKAGDVEVRIVLSTGLASELEHLDAKAVWARSFDELRSDAEGAWRDVLSTIQVEGGTPEQRHIFYTSLYRVFHSPFQVTDEDFTHFLGTDGKSHQVPFTYYSSWSLWDTYRTKFPLLTWLQPSRASDMMQSLAMLYMTGKKAWSTDYECVPTVRTEHGVAVLLEALRQGISIPNLHEAYPYMVEEVKGLSQKTPDEVLEAVSDYWALSEMARELGHGDDAATWQARGQELFDSVWTVAFEDIDTTFVRMKGNGLYQGTRWQYRWGAPMYLDRMVRMVGRKRLTDQLHSFFAQELYNQGNEPDIHTPFLFNRLGCPAKTSGVVRHLRDEVCTHRYGGNDAYPVPYVGKAFVDAPRGYCPEMDEDDGAMSAWYVYAALGMYPTVVGEARMDLFEPLFDEVIISRPGEHRIVIRKDKTRHTTVPTWNGRRLKNYQITHAQLCEGGELVF